MGTSLQQGIGKYIGSLPNGTSPTKPGINFHGLTFPTDPGRRRWSSLHRTTPSFREVFRNCTGSSIIILGEFKAPREISQVTICSSGFMVEDLVSSALQILHATMPNPHPWLYLPASTGVSRAAVEVTVLTALHLKPQTDWLWGVGGGYQKQTFLWLVEQVSVHLHNGFWSSAITSEEIGRGRALVADVLLWV